MGVCTQPKIYCLKALHHKTWGLTMATYPRARVAPIQFLKQLIPRAPLAPRRMHGPLRRQYAAMRRGGRRLFRKGNACANFPAFRKQKVVFADAFRAHHNTTELCKTSWLQ